MIKKGLIGVCIDKNKRGFGKLVERGIEMFSKVDGYHTFLILDEKTGIEAHAGKGVYKFDLDKYRLGNEVVLLIDPDITPMQRALMCKKAEDMVGQKYDMGQIFGFALFGKGSMNKDGKKVCSTLVGHAAYHAGVQFRGLRPDAVMPADIKIHADCMGWDKFYLNMI